jgi:hypothetical protein
MRWNHELERRHPMTIEIKLVLGLIVSAVILFATERLPVEKTTTQKGWHCADHAENGKVR